MRQCRSRNTQGDTAKMKPEGLFPKLKLDNGPQIRAYRK